MYVVRVIGRMRTAVDAVVDCKQLTHIHCQWQLQRRELRENACLCFKLNFGISFVANFISWSCGLIEWRILISKKCSNWFNCKPLTAEQKCHVFVLAIKSEHSLDDSWLSHSVSCIQTAPKSIMMSRMVWHWMEWIFVEHFAICPIRGRIGYCSLMTLIQNCSWSSLPFLAASRSHVLDDFEFEFTHTLREAWPLEQLVS